MVYDAARSKLGASMSETRVAARALLLASLLGGSPAVGAAAPPVPGLQAGFAKRVITPSLDGGPVYLAGFGHDRKATGVHDDLFVRCLGVSDGHQKIALCAVDLIGFFLPETEKTRLLLAARVPGSRLVVASTHDHEGPDTMGLWGPNAMTSGVDPAYQERLRRDIAETAVLALAAVRPASFTFAKAKTPGLVADGRDPQVIDDAIVVIQVKGDDGKTLGTVVNWSSHPEALGGKNTLVTADYPHYLVARIEAALGGTAVFFSGSIGGLMTPLSVGLKDEAGREVPPETFAHAQVLGERAADIALQALRRAPAPAKSAALEYRSARVFVPLANPLFRIAFAVSLFDRPLFTKGVVDRSTGLSLFKGVPLPLPRGEDIGTEIGYVRLADAEILLVPGEIYPELVMGGIQDPQDAGADFLGAAKEPPLGELLRAEYKMVFGLANDELGYIIPRAQWDEKPPFAYGRDQAQYGEVNSVGDRVAPVLAEAYRALLRPNQLPAAR